METINIFSLKPNENNPRFLTERQLERLKKSIGEFKEMMDIRPIIVDENNTILGGNMRYRALVELEFTEVPKTWVKQVKLTEKQKKEFIIKDNVAFGKWEWDDLANDWDANKLKDWGLDVPLFEEIPENLEKQFEEEKKHTEIRIKINDENVDKIRVYLDEMKEVFSSEIKIAFI